MKSKNYVLIIAIQHYNNSKNFKEVDYAENDAMEIEKAFINLGFDKDNINILINNKATYTAILHKINQISQRVELNDRIFIYFAGHGFYINEVNTLAPVDAEITDLTHTCLSIELILGILKKSNCNKCILFLDCCHSGFEPGKDTRESSNWFLGDELLMKYSKEEFCVGFSSCRTNQVSISHPSLKHGVWTYFLIKALNGEAKNIYDHGILFSHKLQEYLRDETTKYVKIYTTKKNDQTPIKFGFETNKFIIADLNKILEEKARQQSAKKFNLLNITLFNEEEDKIKYLPEFKKGHHIPDKFGRYQESFIQNIGDTLIKEDIDDTWKKIKEGLKIKLSDARISKDFGSGSIATPDFVYNIEILQSKSTPSNYLIIRKLDNLRNSNIIEDFNFNKIFSNTFDIIEYEFSKLLNIKEMIEIIEGIGNDKGIKVEYDVTDLSFCKVLIDGTDFNITFNPNSFSFQSYNKTSPDILIKLMEKAKITLAKFPELLLLNY